MKSSTIHKRTIGNRSSRSYRHFIDGFLLVFSFGRRIEGKRYIGRTDNSQLEDDWKAVGYDMWSGIFNI